MANKETIAKKVMCFRVVVITKTEREKEMKEIAQGRGVSHKNYLRTRKRNTIRESRKEHHNKRKGRGCKFDEVTNGEDKYVDGIGT